MGITRTIRDRLVAIERTMLWAGEAVNAAAYIPPEIQPFTLPLFVNFPAGPARAIKHMPNTYLVTRPWTIRLYAKQAGDGLLSDNEDMILDLIDLTYELFMQRHLLNLTGLPALTNVTNVRLTGDSNPVILRYPASADDGSGHYGAEFSLETEYRVVC